MTSMFSLSCNHCQSLILAEVTTLKVKWKFVWPFTVRNIALSYDMVGAIAPLTQWRDNTDTSPCVRVMSGASSHWGHGRSAETQWGITFKKATTGNWASTASASAAYHSADSVSAPTGTFWIDSPYILPPPVDWDTFPFVWFTGIEDFLIAPLGTSLFSL